MSDDNETLYERMSKRVDAYQVAGVIAQDEESFVVSNGHKKLTWGEFKRAMEESGYTDETEVLFSDAIIGETRYQQWRFARALPAEEGER
jgi:hypothetical protein